MRAENSERKCLPCDIGCFDDHANRKKKDFQMRFLGSSFNLGIAVLIAHRN